MCQNQNDRFDTQEKAKLIQRDGSSQNKNIYFTCLETKQHWNPKPKTPIDFHWMGKKYLTVKLLIVFIFR